MYPRNRKIDLKWIKIKDYIYFNVGVCSKGIIKQKKTTSGRAKLNFWDYFLILYIYIKIIIYDNK